jgi:hypothetical protein
MISTRRLPPIPHFGIFFWGSNCLLIPVILSIIFSSFNTRSSDACCPSRQWLQILFYEADVANEPPHVHVTKEGNEAKFWLDPVRVGREGRFRKSDLRDIQRIIEDNLQFLLNAWNQEKSKHVNS